MKTKTILIIALAAGLGGSAVLIAPHRLLAADTTSASRKILHYTCPMHPSVKSDKPGDCPICGMTLQPVYEMTRGTNAPPATVNTNNPAAAMPGCCSMSGGCSH
jgi:cytochrome c556